MKPTMHLNGSGLGAKSGVAFGLALRKNTVLEALELNDNPAIGDKAGLEMDAALGVNTTLLELGLANCGLLAKAKARLSARRVARGGCRLVF